MYVGPLAIGDDPCRAFRFPRFATFECKSCVNQVPTLYGTDTPWPPQRTVCAGYARSPPLPALDGGAEPKSKSRGSLSAQAIVVSSPLEEVDSCQNQGIPNRRNLSRCAWLSSKTSCRRSTSPKRKCRPIARSLHSWEDRWRREHQWRRECPRRRGRPLLPSGTASSRIASGAASSGAASFGAATSSGRSVGNAFRVAPPAPSVEGLRAWGCRSASARGLGVTPGPWVTVGPVPGELPIMDVLFAVLPFADINRPAIGVSLLKAAIARRGFSSRVEYFNLDLAERLGYDLYH